MKIYPPIDLVFSSRPTVSPLLLIFCRHRHLIQNARSSRIGNAHQANPYHIGISFPRWFGHTLLKSLFMDQEYWKTMLAEKLARLYQQSLSPGALSLSLK